MWASVLFADCFPPGLVPHHATILKTLKIFHRLALEEPHSLLYPMKGWIWAKSLPANLDVDTPLEDVKVALEATEIERESGT